MFKFRVTLVQTPAICIHLAVADISKTKQSAFGNQLWSGAVCAHTYSILLDFQAV